MPHRLPGESHALRVRGLKQKAFLNPQYLDGSHALRVRGLKQRRFVPAAGTGIVARSTRAWIETSCKP